MPSYLESTRVKDYLHNQDRGKQTSCTIEQSIATLFSVLCMFLAALNVIFAVLMFVYYKAMLEDTTKEEVNGMTTNLMPSNHCHSNSIMSMLHS
eukprot:8460558-Ditylum_brightwellii.AAC.1